MSKNKIKLLSVLMIFFGFLSCSEKSNDTHLAVENDKTVVERYGHLKVVGTNLCDESGNPVQLRGMSSHGLQWHGKYANYDVLKWLRDDWNCQLWRAAMYVTEGGYVNNPVIKTKVVSSIEAALELGMYVIVDWHILGTGDPNVHKEAAKAFFEEIARNYGEYPNIIYELCNEPNGKNVDWDNCIKPYAEELIQTIRAIDKDNIIIVGTSTWSQDVDKASENLIQGQENIMYTLHFYAGSHGEKCRSRVKKALKNGAPVFVTEWGTTKDSGDGGVFEKETLAWLKFLEKNNISWANWSVNNKGEDSGILKFNADRFGKGGWTEKDLSPDGIFMRKILRNEIK